MKLLHIFLISLVGTSLYAQSSKSQNYVVTNSGDTVLCSKISYFSVIGKEGKLKITKEDGSREKLDISTVDNYQLVRKRGASIYQVACMREGVPKSCRPLLLGQRGALTVLYDREGNQYWPYVTGEGFRGFVTKAQNIKKLMTVLQSCDAFNEKFQAKEQRRYKYLAAMIRYYNENCGN